LQLNERHLLAPVFVADEGLEVEAVEGEAPLLVFDDDFLLGQFQLQHLLIEDNGQHLTRQLVVGHQVLERVIV
jgi:hypothetical protein